MKPARWVIAHFSPTGTTVKTARAIAEGSGCPFREVDLSVSGTPEPVAADELLLAAAPVFGGRIPAVALKRLAALKGSGQKAAAVVVYGNRAYDDALLELKDALEENSFQVIAAAAFIAEHSIARQIAAARPDSSDLEKAAAFGAAVAEKAAQEAGRPIQVPGDPAYREKKGKPSAAHPQADESCIRCGLCASRCPLGAISPEEPGSTDGDRCINCMRCVAVCPQKARSLPAPMLAAVAGMLREKASVPRQPEIFL